MNSICSSIINRVNSINYYAKNGYVSKNHSLYPDRFYEEPSHFTIGGTLVPALNIITKDSFNALNEALNEYDLSRIYKIGSLDFFDEYVDFFGSFQHCDALYTKLSLEELSNYGLPECFLKTVSLFKHPEGNKWHHESLYSGDPKTTVIVVLSDDGVDLYRRH